MVVKAFDKYNQRDVYEKLCLLRKDPDEWVEDFANQFLHICCEIPDKLLKLDFLMQEFRRLVHVSQYTEICDLISSPNLADHEAP